MNAIDPPVSAQSHALAARYGTEAQPSRLPWNDVITSLLQHRSVRGYRPDPVPPGTLETMMAAAQSAATSSNLQTWAVVEVTDPAARAELAKIAGGQKHIVECPLYLVWLADLSRTERIAQAEGKPLEGAPYLVERGISLAGLNEPKLVFQGNATEGARGFPANVNVAAALGLAGIGPDRTTLEIWADPTVERNTHTIEVEGDTARLTLKIENVPSEENPRTGKIVAPSVIACLGGMTAPLRVST